MKKLLLSLVFMILLIGTISAYDFSIDDYKVYTPLDKYGIISIWDRGQIGDDTKLVEYALQDNTDSCIEHCSAKGTATLYSAGTLFDGIEFKNLDTGNIKSIDNKIYLVSYEDYYVDVDDYKQLIDEKNGSYYTEKSGTHQEKRTREIKTEYRGEELKVGSYIWKIEGTKGQYENIDWIATSGIGLEKMPEWATWNASFESGLVHYWNCNEGTGSLVQDIRGKAWGYQKNGTLGGNWAEGINGTACNSTPTSIAAFNLTGFLNPNLKNNTFTLNLWFNSVMNGNENDIYGTLASTGTNQHRMHLQNGQTVFVIGGGAYSFNDNAFGFGHWEMMTIILNTSSVLIYRNGTLIDQRAATMPTDAWKDLRMGGIDGGYSYRGAVDEVGIWNRTLSSSEVSDLYSTGIGIFFPNPTVPPVVTQSIPINFYNSSTSSITLGCNFSSTEQDISSVSVNVWKSSNVLYYNANTTGLATKSVNSTWALTNVPNDKYNWSCSLYGADGTNITSSNRTFTINHYPPITFGTGTPTSYFNSTSQSLYVNVTSSDAALQNITIRLFDSTKTIVNTTVRTSSPAVVTFILSSKGTYYYNATACDSLSNCNSTETRVYNYVDTYFGLCNSSLTVPYLNITFKDEGDSSNINATISSSFSYYNILEGISAAKTYALTNSTANPGYTFCVSPGSETINVSLNIQYDATGYPSRTWNPNSYSSYTNGTTNRTLYLLKSADGIYVTFQVVNSASQPIENVLLNATTISAYLSGLTDAAGSITYFLNPDVSTTINAFKTGYPLYSTSIFPTQTSYTIVLGASTSTYTNPSQGVTAQILPTLTSLTNGTTYGFNFTVNSTYWTLAQYGFNITNEDGVIVSSGFDTAGAGGIVNKNVNTGSNATFTLTAYYIANGTTVTSIRRWSIINDADNTFSILYFGNDLKDYLSTGMFGLTIPSFSGNIIIFLIILVTAGVFSYKFGITSPAAISFMIFIMVAIFDVGLGLIQNPLGAFDNIITIFMFLVTTALVVKEATGF